MVSLTLAGGEPPAVTRIATVLVLGPWASVGVHVKTPVEGLMIAPDGAPASRLKLSACAGMSPSNAVAVKDNKDPSFTERFPIGESEGGLLSSVTTTVKLMALLRAGE